MLARQRGGPPFDLRSGHIKVAQTAGVAFTAPKGGRLIISGCRTRVYDDRTVSAERYAGQSAFGQPAGDQWHRPRTEIWTALDGRAARAL